VPRIDWTYRNDGGSDAYFGGVLVATLMPDRDAFTLRWRSGAAQSIARSRDARARVYLAVEDVPWNAEGGPDL
jgi:hypothetical protein